MPKSSVGRLDRPALLLPAPIRLRPLLAQVSDETYEDLSNLLIFKAGQIVIRSGAMPVNREKEIGGTETAMQT